MKVGWVAPLHAKCGIAFYAGKYAHALSGHVDLVECDPEDFRQDRKGFIAGLSGCDCVHIQYETSLFCRNHTDLYPALCREVRAKKIVTLHEIYRRIPGVFPRENCTGARPLRALKGLLWDVRHPHWASFARHRRASFFADAIVVHSQFQKDILLEKGIDKEKIAVIPMPVQPRRQTKTKAVRETREIVLGATGFINPLYDYDLLVKVLEKLKGEWRFIWIGGIRRNEDAHLLQTLEQEIDRRGWKQRFTITGWVSDEERDRLLDEMHVFCAFFKERSSSESLADSIASAKIIVATRMPLTEEMVVQGPVLALAPQSPQETAEFIVGLLSDGRRRRSMEQASSAYAKTYSYDECAKTLAALYERVVAT
jgi:glycosyltransferase involved in cell wall biosynthesis